MAAQPTEPTAPQSLEDEWRTLSYDEQYERMHNAASFVDIPDEQIPGGKITRLQIKLALKLRALSGHDCYAYQSASLTALVLDEQPQRQWVIWDRIENDPGADARFTPREWAIRNGFAVDGKESA